MASRKGKFDEKDEGKISEQFSFLFDISDDWLIYLVSWLDISSVGNLDIAVAHRHERLVWLRCLRAMDAKTIDQ